MSTMYKISLILLLSASFLPNISYSHGGGLDKFDCHHNRKADGYHCHRGPLAGESFASKKEMLKKLKAGSASGGK